MAKTSKRNRYIKSNFLTTKGFWNIILLAYLVLGIVVHILFFIFTGAYLITSGTILYPFILVSVYYLIKFPKWVFRLKFTLVNFRTTIISIGVCLIIIEFIFIFTGYKSTYLEKRYVYFYESPFDSKNRSWFHVSSKDHNLETSEYCFPRKINSLGLSDIEHPVEKKENEFRIIGLGDSFTEGDGTDKDSTWLKFLEYDFNKIPLKKDVTFINAGVCGSDPFFEYILLKEKLIKYKPDLVVVSFNNSDIFDVFYRGGIERFLPNGKLKYNTPPSIEPLFAISHISRIFIQKMLHYNELLFKKHSNGLEIAKEKIFQSLFLFDKLSNDNNFKLLILFHPMKNEIINKNEDLWEVIKKAKCIKGIDCFDLFDYYTSIEKIDPSNVSDYYWKNDGHHNAKGYQLYARGVMWKLKEMGIIDSINFK